MKDVKLIMATLACAAVTAVAFGQGAVADEITGTVGTGTGFGTGIGGTVIAAPTANPTAGTYTGSRSVTLTAAGSSSIRYATGNTVPNCSTVGTNYAGPITVSSSSTIRAISCYPNNLASSVAAFNYTISQPSSVSGGGGNTAVCSSVVYSEWSSCLNGQQTRTILSRVPSNCVAQTDQLTRVCSSPPPVSPPSQPTASSGEGNVGSCSYNNATEKLLCEGKMARENSPESIAETSGKSRDAGAEQTSRSIVDRIVPAAAPAAIRDRILYFITYGTPSTLILGAGERGGVVHSFQTAFSRLPQSEADWQDVVKLANGRWPGQRNEAAENRAHLSFSAIYGRAANMDNPRDNAAVIIMAYGMRPVPRNVVSEAAAIRTYRVVFNREPVTATAWDAVRAIAYSGATR